MSLNWEPPPLLSAAQFRIAFNQIFFTMHKWVSLDVLCEYAHSQFRSFPYQNFNTFVPLRVKSWPVWSSSSNFARLFWTPISLSLAKPHQTDVDTWMRSDHNYGQRVLPHRTSIFCPSREHLNRANNCNGRIINLAETCAVSSRLQNQWKKDHLVSSSHRECPASNLKDH